MSVPNLIFDRFVPAQHNEHTVGGTLILKDSSGLEWSLSVSRFVNEASPYAEGQAKFEPWLRDVLSALAPYSFDDEMPSRENLTSYFRKGLSSFETVGVERDRMRKAWETKFVTETTNTNQG